MAQLTVNVAARVTKVLVEPANGVAELSIEAVIYNVARGDVIRRIPLTNVTDQLNDTQRARVQAIADQAQSWADARLAEILAGG